MAYLQLTPNQAIGGLHKCFIIAEIGQNHQGDLNIAKKLMKTAKECGANCAKFQKTCIEAKFTRDALNRPYSSKHSWGDTYGDHKRFLEFSEEEFLILKSYAAEIGILFTASAMDLVSLEFLVNIGIPFIKIGSGDANNFVLIEAAAKCNIPLIISTGMVNFEIVKKIYTIVSSYHKNFALLHCISSYPTPLVEINLKVIELYKQEFPDIIIGYSGHEYGIAPTIGAVALGAKIVERHITLDKNQKGSDHKSSLPPREFKQLVDNICQLEFALGSPNKVFQESEQLCYDKLGKTIVFAKAIQAGHKLTLDDLNIKVSHPKGLDGSLIETVVGKILNKNVTEDEPLMANYIN